MLIKELEKLQKKYERQLTDLDAYDDFSNLIYAIEAAEEEEQESASFDAQAEWGTMSKAILGLK